MPEMLEVELYRRSVVPVIGQRIVAVEVPDQRWCSGAEGIVELLTGRRVEAVRRHGKVLLVDTDGPTLGVRFGMTGRLVVDGRSAVPDLAYGAHGDDPRWVRFALATGTGARRTRWEVSDPRRLGGIEIDPDLTHLGPDAADIDLDTALERLGRRTAPIKTVLLDQAVIAGLGNMLADEVLLRSGIAPTRRTQSLSRGEVEALVDAIAAALPEMMAAGGSHRGRLSAERRRAGAPCPLDGSPLERTVIGGRATYWCPSHQMPTCETDR